MLTLNFRTLSDIACCFVLLNENMDYRIHYYLTGKISRNVPSPSTGFSMQELLETSKSFSGTLDHNACLIVIGICIMLFGTIFCSYINGLSK